MFSNANFVIHTHQIQASSVSATGIKSMPVDGYTKLGSFIPISEYGLPSTKKLAKGIANAFKNTDSQAVIMANHGALCYGKDYDDAFLTANQLEEASQKFVADVYKKETGKEYSADSLYELYLNKVSNTKVKSLDETIKLFNSKRTKDGFILYKDDDQAYKFSDTDMPIEALVHSTIYKSRNDINFIKQDINCGLLAISKACSPLRPLLDDFAQIVGRSAHCAKSMNPDDIIKALGSCSGVLIPGAGALCCSATESDTHAVELVMEKNAICEIASKLFNNEKYIGLFDCVLMHFIYTHKYAKKAKS
jgi:L-fuculose-phosphate aldolase